jgi:hypothetical protein
MPNLIEPTPIEEIIEYYRDKCPSFSRLRSEDVLDLGDKSVDGDSGRFRIENAQRRIIFKNATSFTPIYPEVASLSVEEIEKFLIKASDLPKNLCDHYITALAIHFGHETEGKITPLYEVMRLEWNEEDIESEMDVFNLARSKGLYLSAIDAENNSQADTILKDHYRQNVLIQHGRNQNANYEVFDKGKDSEYVVIPFQVILALMVAHKIDQVYLLNTLTIRVHAKSYRHGLILYFEEFAEKFVPVLDKYANRSHLCPPSSNRFKYYLASKE